MTTALFLLRCVELGISISDLDRMTVGMCLDCWSEKARDSEDFPILASQADFDRW